MKATLCIRRSGGAPALHIECAGVMAEHRPFPQDVFQEWADTYAAACRSTETAARLLQLGRKMVAWLDEQNWMAQLLARRDGTLELHVRSHGLDPGDAERALLSAPWEVLANEAGHLAADPNLGFQPVRLLGPGRASRTPSRHCLFGVFMAAEPPGTRTLNYQAEEVALLEATRGVGMDLLVEDSGTLEWVARRLVLPDPSGDTDAVADVLHLSCHGKSEPTPRLLLETDEGDEHAVEAPDLVRALPPNQRPGLLFLSACLTARGDGAQDSLTRGLVRAGLPAVLGWAGSVRDGDATAFARELYQELAAGRTLAHAVATARRALFGLPGRRGQDWHLARLVLGADGGPLVRGGSRRSRLGRRQAASVFLDTKGQKVPVAGPLEFVGRRKPLQDVLRAVRRQQYAGVVLHGVGGLGKSSLAARLHSRLTHHRVALVVSRYRAEDVYRAVAGTVLDAELSERMERDARALRDAPGRLFNLLRPLLQHQLAGHDPEHNWAPVLLVIDDFEQVLGEHGTDDRHSPIVVEGEDLGRTYAELVRAFQACRDIPGGSLLVFTSRVRFALHQDRHTALFEQNLVGLSELEARRQDRARAAVKGRDPLQSVVLEETRRAGFDNPRLMARLFDLAAQDHNAWTQAVREIDDFVDGSHLQVSDAALMDELEGLAIGRLYALAPRSAQKLLRVASAFEMAVPQDVVVQTAVGLGQVDAGEAGERLTDLGLWEPQDDVPGGADVAVAVTSLVRPLLEPWDEGERLALAQVALPLLWGAWKVADRPTEADGQLLDLALLAEDPEVAAASGSVVLAWMWGRNLYGVAEPYVRAIRALVPSSCGPASLWLYLGRFVGAEGDHEGAAACFRTGQENLSGRPDPAMQVLLLCGQAAGLARAGRTETAVEVLAEAELLASVANLRAGRAQVLNVLGRIRVRQGRTKAGLALHQEALGVFRDLGMQRSWAVSAGEAARVLVLRGEMGQALALFEEAMATFGALDDQRSRVLILGEIAQIRLARGELTTGLAVYEEQLGLFEALGAHRDRAHALKRLASVHVLHRRLEVGLALLEEALGVAERVNDRRLRALILGEIARIRVEQGHVQEGLTLHVQQAAVLDELGDRREWAVALGDIAQIRVQQGDLDVGLALHRQSLGVYRAIGDVRECAVTQGNIAQILVKQGQLDEGLAMHREALHCLGEIGDRRERAITLVDIANLQIRRQAWAAARTSLEQAWDDATSVSVPDAVAFVGRDLGELLLRDGNYAFALDVLTQSAAAWRALGREVDARRCDLLVQEAAQHLKT